MLWLACLIFTAGLAWLWAMWSSATVLILAPALSEDLCVLGYLDSFWYFLLLQRLCSFGKTEVTQNHTIFQDLPTSTTEEERREEGGGREEGEEEGRREGGGGEEVPKTYNCQMEASEIKHKVGRNLSQRNNIEATLDECVISVAISEVLKLCTSQALTAKKPLECTCQRSSSILAICSLPFWFCECGPCPEHLSFWHILSSPDQRLKSRALNDDGEQTETWSQDRIPLPFLGRVAKYLLSALPMVAPRCFLLEGYVRKIVAVFLLPHFVTRKIWISEKSNYHTEWACFHRHPCGCGTQFKRAFLYVSNDSPIHSTNVSSTRIWCSKKKTQPCLCRVPSYGETGLLRTQTLVKLNTRRFLKDEGRLFSSLTFPPSP